MNCSIRDECRACKSGGETRHGEEEEQDEGMGEWWLCEANELLDCALFSLPAANTTTAQSFSMSADPPL